MNWAAAELHCHTLHSDGKFTVEELCKAAKKQEYACIALTDHNTFSGHRELTADLREVTLPVIRGIEWTTFFGHMVVLGCKEYVDWRFVVPDTIDQAVEKIKELGGIAGVAHPYVLGSPMCTGCYWDFKVQKWENIDYLEIWSEEFPSLKASNQRSTALWNSLLDQGFRLAPVYGRDWHGPDTGDGVYACTYLGFAGEDINEDSAIEAVQSGHTMVTMGPKLLWSCVQNSKVYEPGDMMEAGVRTESHFFIDMKERSAIWERFHCVPEKFRLVGNGGKVLYELPAAEEANISLMPETGWIRAELWGKMKNMECCIAITNVIGVN